MSTITKKKLVGRPAIKKSVGRPPRQPVTKDIAHKLDELYNGEMQYFGRDKLYQLAKEQGINVSRRALFEWLENQNIYQLYKAPRLTKTIKNTVLSKPRQQIGIDLIDLQNSAYKGYNYILTAIDLFSKKTFAKALKDKTGPTVAKALKYLLTHGMDGISTIRSDRGSEFIDHNFQKVLKDNDIKQILSSAHTPQSNGQIENFNKMIKRLLNMALLSTNSNDWVSLLPKLINNYNNTIHFTTHKTPNQLHSEGNSKILNDVKNIIHRKVTKRRETTKAIFKKGDIVRIKIDPNERNRNREVWTRELYIIKSVYSPRNSTVTPSYELVDENGEKLRNRYYNNDLQKINKVEQEIITEPKYEISKLVEPVMIGRKKGYLVLWKGYRQKTYESRDKLVEDIPKLVKLYEFNHLIDWQKVNKIKQ